ncbi:MAG: hypothetical protein RL040_609 [Bacteroidota bacterium]|jgi:hypothetical protein
MCAKYILNICDTTQIQSVIAKPYPAIFFSALAATKMLTS